MTLTTFGTCLAMREYHEEQAKNSRWNHCRVSDLSVEPLDRSSPLYSMPGAFADGISLEAVQDTADNLGLALHMGGSIFR